MLTGASSCADIALGSRHGQATDRARCCGTAAATPAFAGPFRASVRAVTHHASAARVGCEKRGQGPLGRIGSSGTAHRHQLEQRRHAVHRRPDGISGTMADTTTLQLNDAPIWRMFLFAGQGYRSAISSDGLSFTMEGGNRLAQGTARAAC